MEDEFIYGVFAVALTLACIAGLQFVYLSFVQASNVELRKRIRTLERMLQASSQATLDQSNSSENAPGSGLSKQDEMWPEIIVDDGRRI